MRIAACVSREKERSGERKKKKRVEAQCTSAGIERWCECASKRATWQNKRRKRNKHRKKEKNGRKKC